LFFLRLFSVHSLDSLACFECRYASAFSRAPASLRAV
jgi:hypothetical protein